MKKKKLVNTENGYYQFGIFKISEVIPYISKEKGKRLKLSCGETAFEPNVHSVRLNTFKEKGCSCHYCGLEATHFSLEQGDFFGDNAVPHLNLYSNEEMMTYDHVIPFSKGGKDHLDNTVTACITCNQLKKAKFYEKFVSEISNKTTSYE